MKNYSPKGNSRIVGVLAAAYGSLALFGIVIAVSRQTGIAHGLLSLMIDPFFPSSSPSPETYLLLEFVFGVLGAVMFSWGGLMLFVALGPLLRGEEWAAKALFAATLLWFGIDETFSIVYGVWVNAVGNAVLLVWMLAPLALLRAKGHFTGNPRHAH